MISIQKEEGKPNLRAAGCCRQGFFGIPVCCEQIIPYNYKGKDQKYYDIEPSAFRSCSGI